MGQKVNFKKLPLVIGALLVIVCIAFLIQRISSTIQLKKVSQIRMQRLEQITFLDLDSVPFQLNKSDKSIILSYFNPECDHCQSQAESIKDTLPAFQDVSMVWISSGNISEIKRFSENVGLFSMVFAKINQDKVFETFGSVSVPHIFVYDKTGQLVSEFKGQTSPKKILNSLK